MDAKYATALVAAYAAIDAARAAAAAEVSGDLPTLAGDLERVAAAAEDLAAAYPAADLKVSLDAVTRALGGPEIDGVGLAVTTSHGWAAASVPSDRGVYHFGLGEPE